MADDGIKLNEGNAAADRFRDFTENFPGAVFIYDVRPDGSDLVEYVSRKCWDIWEITPEEAIESAKPIWEIIVPEDVPVMAASIKKSAAEMSGWHCRWRVVTKSKKEKWLEGWGQPRKLPDGTIRWNSMILDVTRQRNAEIALEASRDRALSVRHLETIGTLSSGIAHDFNNLLTVVAGNLDLLRMRLGSQKQFEPILESLSR
ncbi:MAG: PAS domain-containing protein, partial [Bdellovibrionales bacterium]|nr:PAS domain-containing protein [Bdellovibrionales bacterium]